MSAPPLVIREVTRADRAALAFSLQHLSLDSRHRRYFTATPRVWPGEVDRLRTVDHWHREVLIAFSLAPRTPVGFAEYVRLGSFDVAEVAIAVVDRWQRHGVGHSLMAALRSRALATGVRHFQATLLRENKAGLALARSLGAWRIVATRGTLIELIVDL